MRVLVAYASRYGSTAAIAEAIADELRAAGLEADARPAGEVRHLDDADAVVLGSAVYMKRWQRDARRFLRRHRDELQQLPFWVFSSGPVGEDADPGWNEPPKTIATVESLGARDHVVFGGSVPDEPHNFIQRQIARETPEELRDLRDWEQIRGWAGKIAAELLEAPVTPAAS